MDRDDERDPDAPASPEELAAAASLRDALDHGPSPGAENESAEIARAVHLAYAPRPLDDAEHRAIVAGGILRAEKKASSRRRGRGVAVIVVGGLALAAAIALRVTEPAPRSASVIALEPLVPVRSTQPLFREPFARTGGESARIDRIASARASDLRDNRFAAWGVR